MKINYKNSKGYTRLEKLIAIKNKIVIFSKGVKFSKKRNGNSLTGYTLVELLIVVATFVIILIATINLFVLMVVHQQKILAEQELLSQASYVTEYMSRALRMAVKDDTGDCLGVSGKNYLRTQADSGVYHGVKFINASNQNICQEFILEAGRIKEVKNGGTAMPITAESLFIKKFNVQLYGDSPGDEQQPRVVIAIDIERQTKDFKLEKHIQVTVSQRNLDE